MTRSVDLDFYPAIDIRGGQCVRLLEGDYSAEKVYGDDPVAQAAAFVDAGAEWVHVVDLDAARTGSPENRDAIAAICSGVSARVQCGGGVRSEAAARDLLAVGVERVVVGTAAVNDPGLVDRLCREHPTSVAVGLDARGRDLATHGWTESSGRDLVELAIRFSQMSVAALVVTEIGRDGTLRGPDLDQLSAVMKAVGAPVIASGGVSDCDDLRALAALEVGGRRLSGVIAGRSLYEGRFTVEEAISACSRRA